MSEITQAEWESAVDSLGAATGRLGTSLDKALRSFGEGCLPETMDEIHRRALMRNRYRISRLPRATPATSA